MAPDLARGTLSDAAWGKSGIYPSSLEWGASRGRAPRRSVEVPDRGVTLHVEWEGEEPAWVEPTLHALGKLLALPANWDSYGAHRVDLKSAALAGQTLCLVMRGDTIPPTIVPTSEGGVQLEWHTHSIDLEIDTPPTGPSYVYCRSRQENTEWEGDVSTHFEQLRGVISRLSPHR